MKAELKYFNSPDINDLENFKPQDPKNFGFLLQIFVGLKGGDGEESFDIIVCTPSWLDSTYSSSDQIFGEHYIIVFEYNFQKLLTKISDFINRLDEESWELLASKIDRIGGWEFRDYIE
jgi:Immunity protein 8